LGFLPLGFETVYHCDFRNFGFLPLGFETLYHCRFFEILVFYHLDLKRFTTAVFSKIWILPPGFPNALPLFF
jgi:hypothetical protein